MSNSLISEYVNSEKPQKIQLAYAKNKINKH